MKKWSIIIFVWYFYFQHPVPDSLSAKVMARVGPYATQEACTADAEELLNTGFPGLKVTKCVDERDA